MSFFDDNTYDNLDWLSQATMPLVFSGNKLLGEMPDHIDVDISKISLGGYIGVSSTLKPFYVDDSSLNRLITNCYAFKSDGGTIVDPSKDIYPTVWVEKIKKDLSEKEILSYVRDMITPNRNYHNNDIGRINEIMDLINYKPDPHGKNLRASRSINKKMRGIYQRLQQVLIKGEWQVRDADLMISFNEWVNQYIVDGNLAALTNITKLKIMTHKNQPIYSIKEAT